MLVRLANLDDFGFVYKCINELEELEFDINAQRQIYEQNVNLPLCIYLIAEIENQKIGFLSCHAQYLLHHGGLIGEIQEMYVMPEFRSQKVGNRLLKELVTLAKQKSVLQIEVTSNVNRVAAHRFYINNGFLPTHQKFTFELENRF